MRHNSGPPIVAQLGNAQLLSLPKTAFLCSRRYPAGVVLKAYDWAIAQRESGQCVVSGFHSQLEKDVLHYLLKGQQPIIVVLARGLPKRIDPPLLEAIEGGRLLLVSPFAETVRRVTADTAHIRNRLILHLSDEVLVAHAQVEGQLANLINQLDGSSKPLVMRW